MALSTDEFNAGKGKKAFHDYETRKMMLEAIRYVDLVIPEEAGIKNQRREGLPCGRSRYGQ